MSTFAAPRNVPDAGTSAQHASPEADPVLANYDGTFDSSSLVAPAWGGAGLDGVAGASPGGGAGAATADWSVDWNTIGLSEDWGEWQRGSRGVGRPCRC